ncbi:DUF7919 family protein [Streptomyces capillispiralis]|uniref:DUF7919 family protein n=1 Tax=Streptomyces capillispiralis TaxID=68182 RepID=UPI004032FB6B
MGTHPPSPTKRSWISTTFSCLSAHRAECGPRVVLLPRTLHAAPNLVIHHMTAHHYCPPEEFCRAVARTAGIATARELTPAE